MTLRTTLSLLIFHFVSSILTSWALHCYRLPSKLRGGNLFNRVWLSFCRGSLWPLPPRCLGLHHLYRVPPPPPRRGPHHPDLFNSFSLNLTVQEHRPPPPPTKSFSSLFTMKYRLSGSGRLAFDWNAFLFQINLKKLVLGTCRHGFAW